MENVSFNSDLLIMVAGAVLSALFTYIPKFNAWFAAKTDEFKQLTMLILMFVITVVYFTLACFEVITVTGFMCDKGTAFSFIYTFILATMSNQATYMITPKPLAVKQASDIDQSDELYKGKFKSI